MNHLAIAIPRCHACPLRKGSHCGADERHELIGEKATRYECPAGRFPPLDGPIPPPPEPVEVSIATVGPALWADLHRWALGNPTEADGRPWLGHFARRVPCRECRRHWVALLAELPPRFGPDAFAWSVEAHNAVNARLGKPLVSLDAARERWG